MPADNLSGAVARERIAELRRRAEAARLARAARPRRQTRRWRLASRDLPALTHRRQPS